MAVLGDTLGLVASAPPNGCATETVLARFVVQGSLCAIVQHTPATAAACLGRFALSGQHYAIIELGKETRGDLLELLTPRELEIALLIAAGHESKAVARRLRISFHTVRVHLGRIYCKLGLHKQTELAVLVSARYGAIG